MKPLSRTLIVWFCLVPLLLGACAHHKIPVILERKPDRPYEMIGEVETKVEWGGLQWLWFWWHYLPGYSATYKTHNDRLIKEAQKLDADAIINVEYLPHRSGARGDAIRYQ